MPIPAAPPPVSGGVCTPWTDATAVLALPGAGDLDPDAAGEAATVASGILYSLSGRQFPGACTSTIRPHGGGYGCRHPSHLGAWSVVDSRTAATNGWPCSDGGLDLGLYPVRGGVEVLLDGTALDPDAYRVDGQRWLVRTGGLGWPADQDLDHDPTEAGTFAVTVVHGADPPPAGVRAAALLAAEMAKGWAGLANQLPKRVTNLTRQQVSVTVADPASYFAQGLIGITEVDLFLTTYNPGRQRAKPLIWSPELGRRRRV